MVQKIWRQLEQDHLFNRYAKFSEKPTFLPPDTRTYMCVKWGKKCYLFGKFSVSAKCMISDTSPPNGIIGWELPCPFYCFVLTLLSNITARKMSVFRVFPVRIFPYSDWIRRDTMYLSVFSPIAGQYGPRKLRIRTLCTQCLICHRYR